MVDTTDTPNTKVFNDPIHGHIELHPLCVKIIDTPQFQRLRFLKQLGACYFVYPGASHNRFEHSIGVCHLAGRLVRALQRRQPELDVSDVDVLCVEIAGLCHDLGHGPFSHLFDKFISATSTCESESQSPPPSTCESESQSPPKREKKSPPTWKHEERSRLMLTYLIYKNKLLPVFKQHGLKEDDIDFIGELITASLNQASDEGRSYAGRDQSKSFLYEIVANKRSGIDVDKWDYFARDCHMLGIKNNFDHNRCIQFTRVIKVDGQYQICFRDKEVDNLYDMFHTRQMLHRRAYQHHVVKIIGDMICEALVKANDYIFFKASDGRDLKMSKCIEDMHAFGQLTDDVFMQIDRSTDSDLAAAKDIKASDGRDLKMSKCLEAMHAFGQLTDDVFMQIDRSTDSDLAAAKDIKASDGRDLKMSKCLEAMHAFGQLTDDVFMQIYRSTDSDLAAAKDILTNIMTRNLDMFVGQTLLNHEQFIAKVSDVRDEIFKKIDSGKLKRYPLEPEELVIRSVNLDYGMKDKNPLDNVRFYSKDNPTIAEHVSKDQVSLMLPEKFCEQKILVFKKRNKETEKRNKETIEIIHKAFEDWCLDKKFPKPKMVELNAIDEP